MYLISLCLFLKEKQDTKERRYWNGERTKWHPDSTPGLTLALSHLPQESDLGDLAAIIGEISCAGPQVWQWITQRSPTEVPSREGNKQLSFPPASVCAGLPHVASPRLAALLDQTPLIETVLFMQENKETHRRACTHTPTYTHTHTCNMSVLQLHKKQMRDFDDLV